MMRSRYYNQQNIKIKKKKNKIKNKKHIRWGPDEKKNKRQLAHKDLFFLF